MKFEKISYKQYKNDFGAYPYCTDGEASIAYICGYDDIELPKRATKKSAGYDIYSPISHTLYPGQYVLIPTGIKFQCDDDKFLMAVPRSGQGFKYGVMLANTVGVIDADYYNNPKNEGHIWVKLVYPVSTLNTQPMQIKEGDAICQCIISPYYTVDDDDADGDRVGGFGSTGGTR